MPRVISLGEALIDLFGGKGTPLRELKPLQPFPGGAPANVAVALARLGIEVGFIGRVGADDYGAFLIELMAGEGVDVTHFVADPQALTMLAVVAAPSPTEQHFVLYHGADTLLRPEQLDQAYIQSARCLVFGSVTLAEASGPAALQAARWAREAGHHVIFDVNLRPSVWPDLPTARRCIQEAIALATVVKLSEVELKFLTGMGDPAAGSRTLVERGVPLCCVSLGAEGSYFNNGVISGHVPAFPVNVIDTTGSGDAFVAGLACELSNQDQPLRHLSSTALYQILRFANACGALSATRLGAMSALPTREAVERLLRGSNSEIG